MTLKNAQSIDDVTYEDVIDFRELAEWLRDFADPEMYEDEGERTDITEYVASTVIPAIVKMLNEMGYREGSPTWGTLADKLQEFGNNYGAALIRDSYWIDYVKDYAEESAQIDGPTQAWPFNHVDWEAAAEELEEDWSRVDFGGVEFLVRDF